MTESLEPELDDLSDEEIRDIKEFYMERTRGNTVSATLEELLEVLTNE